MAINFEPIDADPSYGDVSLISGPSPTRIRSKLNFFGGLLLHTQEISHFTNNGSEAGGGISVESHGLKSVSGGSQEGHRLGWVQPCLSYRVR